MRINKISMQGGKSNLWFMEKKHAICYDESVDKVRGYIGKGGFVMSNFCKSEIVVLTEKSECVTVDRKRIRREKFKYHLKEVLLELLPFAVVFLLFFIPTLLIVNWAKNECFSSGVLSFMKISLGIVIASGMIGGLVARFLGGCDLGEFKDICGIIFGGIFTGVAAALIITALVVVLGLLFLIVAAVVAVVMMIVTAIVGIVSLVLWVLPYALAIGIFVIIMSCFLCVGSGEPDAILIIFD